MNVHVPTSTRTAVCSGCPFNPFRTGPELDADTKRTVAARILGGERWICHQTCDGARVTAASQFCAGAPTPFDEEAQRA